MKKIASFEVDHTKLLPGIYVSRVDGDITTYDLRCRRPNVEPAMDIHSMHTIEHLAATWLRNSDRKEDIIYFGPMGCRTGFYLLVRNADADWVIRAVQSTMEFIASYEGEIPGSSSVECGNYLSHDLPLARQDALRYAQEIAGWTPENMIYSK